MARLPSRAYRNASAKMQSVSSGSYNIRKSLHPFGPAMACDVFNVYDFDDMDEGPVGEDYYDEVVGDAEEVWYQPDLPLENVREMEQRHLNEIKKYERAYRKMCHHAMKWHNLMEDLESNAQLKKMFNDIQLMRKLSGSEGV